MIWGYVKPHRESTTPAFSLCWWPYLQNCVLKGCVMAQQLRALAL